MEEERWQETAISLVLAVLLWIFVSNESVLVLRREVSGVRLNHINLEQGLKATHTGTVTVQLRGEPKNAADLYAYVDLQGLGPGIHTVPVKVGPVDSATVTGVQPQEVQVQISELAENLLPVQCRLEAPLPAGYTLEGLVAVPEKCLVKGATSAVASIDSLLAAVDGRAIRGTRAVEVEPRPVDKDGNPVPGDFALVPDKVKVYVVVSQQAQLREARVRADLQGSPAEGCTVGEVQVVPATVTLVGGDLPVGEALAVSTAAVDLAGRDAPFRQEVPVVAPAGSRAFPARVTVLVDIRAAAEGGTP
jgi:YbbR domain-containing protein